MLIAAEKSRQLTGSLDSSTGGMTRKERFTFLDCFDMRYGTLACLLKEVIKFTLYYIRAVHVHKVKTSATQKSLTDNLSKGKTLEEAINSARQAGNASARRASLEVKHIIVPLMTSVWDLIETLYVGGTPAEGTVRCISGFIGAYGGGLIGEGDAGWLGFLLGSQMGGWVGGRIGLMAYDTWNGVLHLIQVLNSLPIAK
ncbi:OLC1v1003684C1 [Oldenlandia corymbosa var. corymbosa]|uniref:OLC1v1003684C1 n=1 Tax=Oldenlandia corymbosa var. corymbosa TaxID=529605 RepID=A0AAV1DDB0_OLDCO|nr:OLC1v1003684C1 [Oldenlandia corymbosa var. corymbosa]